MVVANIAMKCNPDQYKEIEDILQKSGLKLKVKSDFRKYPFLTNIYQGEKNIISNIHPDRLEKYNRVVYKQWDKEVFLSYINTEPNWWFL